MYSMLLQVALEQEPEGGPAASPAEALGRVLRRRAQIDPDRPPQWASSYDAMIDSLSYDVALVQLASLVGIECEISNFDQAGSERSRLERDLVKRGLPLDALVDSSDSGTGSQTNPF